MSTLDNNTDAERFGEKLSGPRSDRVQLLFQFQPFDYQETLLDQTGDVVKAAVKPGRQVGKTVTGGAIAADASLAGKDVMILGPFHDTVSEMMEAAREHLNTAEENYSSAGYSLGTEYRNKFDWNFSHDGRLRARTVGTDGTQIRGKNPEVVLVDEAAYIKDTIFTEVIEPFFSTHSSYEYYLFSTPAGKSGYFYEKVEQDNSFYSPHWPSEICPLISDDWLKEKEQELDTITYAQEYLGEFVDEGETLFTFGQINDLTGDVELDGELFLGVDIARGGTDRTVYAAMDNAGNTRILDSEETSTMDGVLGRIKDLHREHGFAEVVVEENSMGGGVVDFGGDLSVISPFKTSTKTKHQLYKQLQRDIEAGNICLENHRRLIDELSSLQYEFTQHSYMKVHHPDGGHDDHADAVAMANWGRTGGNSQTIKRRKARATMHKGQ